VLLATRLGTGPGLLRYSAVFVILAEVVVQENEVLIGCRRLILQIARQPR
jgi:hypothetical protein